MTEYTIERFNAESWEDAKRYVVNKYGRNYREENIRFGTEEVLGFNFVIFTTSKKTAQKYINTIRNSVSDLLSF